MPAVITRNTPMSTTASFRPRGHPRETGGPTGAGGTGGCSCCIGQSWSPPGRGQRPGLVGWHSPGYPVSTQDPGVLTAFRAPSWTPAEGGTQEMADFKLQPLEDRIVVQANEGDQTTASGLVIPDTAKEKPQEGTVVAAGPG